MDNATESASVFVDAAAAAADDSQPSGAKRPRKTFAQVSAIRAADLAILKQKDTTGCTEKRKANHEAAIEALSSKVAADTIQAEKAMQRSISKSSTATVRASPMKEDQTRRLIYARKFMDEEFDKFINAAVSKWDMTANLFNNGFTVNKNLLAGVEEDIVFPPLPEG
jgi:hypothetical protein